MEYFLYAAYSLALLVLLGLGFTLLLLPKDLRQYSLLVAPWIGYCYAIFVCWNLYQLGIKIGRLESVLILVPPAVCLGGLILRRGVGAAVKGAISIEAGVAVAIVGVILALLSIPALGTPGGTTISLGNHDAAYYADISRFLSEFGRGSNEGFVGQIPADGSFTKIAENDHFGAWAFPAWQTSCLGVMPHQVFTLCCLLFAALIGAAAFVALRDGLLISRRYAFFGVFLVGAQPITYFNALDGFLAQLIGMGLAVMMFWSTAKLLRPKVDRVFLRHCALLGISTSGLLLTYQHMLPFVWLFAATYLFSVAVATRRWRDLKWCVVGAILATALAAALTPQRAAELVVKVRFAASATAGWFMPFLLPSDATGLFNKHVFAALNETRIHYALSIAISVLLVLVVVAAWRQKLYRVTALAAGCGLIYAGAAVLGFKGAEAGHWGGYRSFKLLSYFLPFFAMLVAAGFAITGSYFRRTVIVAKAILFLVFCHGYFRSNKELMQSPALGFMRVGTDYNVLLDVDRDPQIDSVNILSENFWETMWSTYFLLHKKVYPATETYFPAAQLVGTYNLVDKRAAPSEIIHIISKVSVPVRKLNDRFSLVGPTQRIVSAKLGAGWYPAEVGHVWSGSAGRRATIIVHSREDGAVIRLSLSCSRMRPGDSLSVQLGGEPYDTHLSVASDGNQIVEAPAITLHQGDNEIELVTKLEPVRIGPQDPRLVCYLYSDITVEDVTEKSDGATPRTEKNYRFGTVVRFGSGGHSEQFRRTGWSATEKDATWTIGDSATLVVPLARNTQPLRLRMRLAAFIHPPELPFQPVEVFANGERIADWQVSNKAEFTASIPSTAAAAEEALTIELKIPKAVSPQSLHWSDDPRQLGVFCYDLSITVDN